MTVLKNLDGSAPKPQVDPRMAAIMGKIPLRPMNNQLLSLVAPRSPHETIDNLANAETMAEDPNDMNYLSNLADINAGREIAKLHAPPETVYVHGAAPQAQTENIGGTPRLNPLAASQSQQFVGQASPHRGLMGRIGHGLLEAGEAVGSQVAPTAMSVVPGTELNKALEAKIARTRGEAQAQAGAGALSEQRAELAREEIASGMAPADVAAQLGKATEEQAQAELARSRAVFQGIINKSANPADVNIGQEPTPPTNKEGQPLIDQDFMNRYSDYVQSLATLGKINPLYADKYETALQNLRNYQILEREQNFGKVGSMPGELASVIQPLLSAGSSPDEIAHAIIQYQSRKAGAEAGARGAAAQQFKLMPIYDPNTHDLVGYASVGGGQSLLPGNEPVNTRGGIMPGPTTTTVNQAQNAASLTDMIQKNIFPAIDAAAKENDMGPAEGRVQQFLLRKVGNPNSAAARLQATLDAVPMMLGRMYGYRSAEYAQHLTSFMNTRMTPEALKAYLNGVVQHASVIRGEGGMMPKNAGKAWVQKNAKGQYRYSTDGGKTWHAGRPKQ